MWTYGNIKRLKSVNIFNTNLSLRKGGRKNVEGFDYHIQLILKIKEVISPFEAQRCFIQPPSIIFLFKGIFKLKINIVRIF